MLIVHKQTEKQQKYVECFRSISMGNICNRFLLDEHLSIWNDEKRKKACFIDIIEMLFAVECDFRRAKHSSRDTHKRAYYCSIKEINNNNLFIRNNCDTVRLLSTMKIILFCIHFCFVVFLLSSSCSAITLRHLRALHFHAIRLKTIYMWIKSKTKNFLRHSCYENNLFSCVVYAYITLYPSFPSTCMSSLALFILINIKMMW